MCYFFLIETTFIQEIEDKYDLESKVKVYPKFLLTDLIKENGELLHKI